MVGYNTVTIDKDWTILAVNFEKVSGGSMTINEAFPCAEGMKQGNESSGDIIQVQKVDGSGYDSYFLSDGWFSFRGTPTFYADRVGKWFKTGETAPTATPLNPGQAFWYNARKYDPPFTVSVAGSVIADVSKEVVIDKDWKHIANPYPVALPVDSIGGDAEGMKQGNETTADIIQVQKAEGSGYDSYFLSDGWFSFRGTPTFYEDRKGHWFKSGETTPTTATIPVGKGAWYNKRNDATITIVINNPVK